MAESRAPIGKLVAESDYIKQQRKFYQLAIASGVALAMTAVVKFFL